MLLFGVLAYVVVTQSTPLYTATSVIYLDKGREFLGESSGCSLAGAAIAGLIDSEVEVLRSYAIAQRAIDDLAIPIEPSTDEEAPQNNVLQRALAMLTGTPAPPDAETHAIGRLMASTEIARRAQTFIVDVNVNHASAQTAARLANAVAQAYLDDQVDTKTSAARQTERRFRRRATDLAITLRALEGQINDRLLSAAAANLARQDGVTAAQSNAVSSMLEQLANERQSLFAEHATLTQRIRADRPGETTSLDDLESERAAIDARLNDLDVTTAQARQQLQDYLDSSTLDPALALSLQRLEHEATTTRQLHQDAVERWREAQFLSTQQEPDARLLTAALPPLTDSRPAPLSVLATGLALGLLVGVAGGLVHDHFFLGITGPQLVERATHLPVVALLPTVSRFDASAPQDLITTHPLSDFAEAVRRLSLTLDVPHEGEAGVETLCVLVTSPNANEGKSTLALAYAMYAAASGKSTLLIDADLRQSALFDRLNWQMDAQGPQFSDALANHGESGDAAKLILRDPQTGLDVLGNVTAPLQAADTLLAGTHFAELIKSARSKYEIIVIDSPPVLSFADARILLGFADRAIMTMRYEQTRLPDIQKALRALDQHRAPHFYGVLTFVS